MIVVPLMSINLVFDDIIDSFLLFRGVSGTNTSLLSITNSDDIFYGTGFSLLNCIDDIADGFASVSEADEIY